MIQIEQQTLQQKQEEAQQEMELKTQEMAQEKQIAEEKNQTELDRVAQDNQTAENIASLRTLSGHSPGQLRNGESLGE